MARSLALIAAVLLCGCNPSNNATGASGAKASATYTSLPLEKAGSILDGYSVRVPREGDILWNGQPVGIETLNSYLQQFARLLASAGRLFVAFEPGVQQD